MIQMINGFHGANWITNTLHHSCQFQLNRLHNFEQMLKIRKTKYTLTFQCILISLNKTKNIYLDKNVAKSKKDMYLEWKTDADI